MSTSKAPDYRIHPRLDEGARWSEVLRKDRVGLRRVIQVAIRERDHLLEDARRLMGRAFKQAYALAGWRSVGKMQAIARAAGVTPGEIVLASPAFELSHVSRWGSGLWSRIFECIAGVSALPSHGRYASSFSRWERGLTS